MDDKAACVQRAAFPAPCGRSADQPGPVHHRNWAADQLPVMISPTGVRAVDPSGEVGVARGAAAAGTAIGLSSFASKPVEEVGKEIDKLLFQSHWVGSRDDILARARAGPQGRRCRRQGRHDRAPLPIRDGRRGPARRYQRPRNPAPGRQRDHARPEQGLDPRAAPRGRHRPQGFTLDHKL